MQYVEIFQLAYETRDQNMLAVGYAGVERKLTQTALNFNDASARAFPCPDMQVAPVGRYVSYGYTANNSTMNASSRRRTDGQSVAILDGSVSNRDGVVVVVVGGVEQTGSGSDGRRRRRQVVARRRLAGVLVDDARALPAGHVTAPAEPAVALVDAHDAPRVVATPTAHDVTAVRPQRRLAAPASGRAQRTCPPSQQVSKEVRLQRAL